MDKLRGLGQFSNLDPGNVDRVAARIRRPGDRKYLALATRLHNLARLAPSPRGVRSTGPRILVGSLRGWSTHSACEAIIAQALRLRGARVALLTCGGGMPACEVGWARRAYPRPCDRCAWLTDRLASVSGLEHYALRDFFGWGADGRGAPTSTIGRADDVRAYARSRISLTWLLRATQVDRLPEGLAAQEDFAIAAEAVEQASSALLARFKPDIIFLLNGLFGAERTIRNVALEHGVRVPTYEIAPRAGCLVLSQNSPAPHYDTDALWEKARQRPLTAHQRSEVMALLEARTQGVGAHERYFDNPDTNVANLRQRYGVSRDTRTATLFTNLSWDSATVGRDVGFESMFEWITEAVRCAAEQDDMVLVIRIHPAERSWGTREEVEAVILDRLGALPPNVRVVPAAEAVSSYALLDLSDLVLTYTTTVGLEAAARGKPVAVAGRTHYRGRGFTIDLAGPPDLASVLKHFPRRLADRGVELALRYAYAFFFRAMVPFPVMSARGPRVIDLPASEQDLAAGADPYLDWICDRILDGGEFWLPDELATAGSTERAPR